MRVTYSNPVRDVELTQSERAVFDVPRDTPNPTEIDDLWVETDVADHWRAAFRLVEYSGKFVVAEVRLMPRDEWPGRVAGQWRAERVGLAAGQLTGERRYGGQPVIFPPLDGMNAALLRAIPFSASVRFGGALPATEGQPPDHSSKSRRGGGRPDRFYAQIAAAYLARLEAGSRHPVADVAQRRKLSAPQVRDAIHTARERGLLTATSKQGRPGGALTALARTLLGRKPVQTKSPKLKRGKIK